MADLVIFVIVKNKFAFQQKLILYLHHLINHVLKEKRNRLVLLGGFGIYIGIILGKKPIPFVSKFN